MTGQGGSIWEPNCSQIVRPHSSCSPHLLPGCGKEKHRQHAIQAIAMSPTLRKRLATINLQRSQFIPSVGDGFFKLGWLVVSTPLKNISQNGNLPQIGVKIKNVWNQHLVGVLYFTRKKECRVEHTNILENSPLSFLRPKHAGLRKRCITKPLVDLHMPCICSKDIQTMKVLRNAGGFVWFNCQVYLSLRKANIFTTTCTLSIQIWKFVLYRIISTNTNMHGYVYL